MIKSFRHKGLEDFYYSGSIKGIQSQHKAKIGRILFVLNRAQQPGDLDIPGFGCHALKGQAAGHWSIWVNGNWRITFRFVGVDVELVDYKDYH